MITWKNDKWCHVFIVTEDDDYWRDDWYYENDYCREVAWAVASFICAVMWGITSYLLHVFVTGGRFEKFETSQSEEEGIDHEIEVEMAAATAVATSGDAAESHPTATASYLPPDMDNKV